VGDLGDIFDMFSQDDEKKRRNGQDAESSEKSNATDPKSLIINKITKNKALLVTVIFVGILIVSAAAYFLINYIGDHGTKGIIDTIKPFIN
jgi:hypothetical protein